MEIRDMLHIYLSDEENIKDEKVVCDLELLQNYIKGEKIEITKRNKIILEEFSNILKIESLEYEILIYDLKLLEKSILWNDFDFNYFHFFKEKFIFQVLLQYSLANIYECEKYADLFFNIEKNYQIGLLECLYQERQQRKNKGRLDYFVYIIINRLIKYMCIHKGMQDFDQETSMSKEYSYFSKFYLIFSKLNLKFENVENNEPIFVSIRNDDVDSFQMLTNVPKFDFNKTFIHLREKKKTLRKCNLICYSAFFGAIKCFKYLIMNGAEISGAVAPFAVAGGNIEIIHLIDQSGFSFYGSLITSIKFHKTDIFSWIYSNTELDLTQTIVLFDCCLKYYSFEIMEKIIERNINNNNFFSIINIKLSFLKHSSTEGNNHISCL